MWQKSSLELPVPLFFLRDKQEGLAREGGTMPQISERGILSHHLVPPTLCAREKPVEQREAAGASPGEEPKMRERRKGEEEKRRRRPGGV